MGSNFKSAVLEEETVHAIKQWHTQVKEKRKKQQQQPNYIQSPQHNSLSATCKNSRTNSPDISSHHCAPTLEQSASRGGLEITEERHQEHEHEHVVQYEAAP